MPRQILLPQSIKDSIPKLYSQEKSSDPMVYVKFFTPWTSWTWYATEGQPDGDNDFIFFGMVEGFEKEFGYFRLSDLTSIKGPFGLRIERDEYSLTVPRKLSELRKQ